MGEQCRIGGLNSDPQLSSCTSASIIGSVDFVLTIYNVSEGQFVSSTKVVPVVYLEEL